MPQLTIGLDTGRELHVPLAEDALHSPRMQPLSYPIPDRDPRSIHEGNETAALEFETLNERLKARREELAEAERTLGGHQRNIKEAIAQRGRLEKEMAQLGDLISRRDTHRVALDKQCQALEACLATGRQHLAAIEERLRASDEVSRRLASTREQQQNASQDLAATLAELSRQRTQLSIEQKALAEAREASNIARGQLDGLRADITWQEQRLAQFQPQLDEARREHSQLTSECQAASQALIETTRSLESLREAELAQLKRRDEAAQLTADIETQYTTRQQAIAIEAAETQEKITELENRLGSLQEWQERLMDCHTRLAAMPHESLEARNLRNEIDMFTASLRQLLSNRSRVAFAPPAASPSKPVPQAEPVLQPATVQETRAARITGTFTMPDKALREQDRRIEDKIRVNEARLELLEARLRRGEEDEKCQREKIATLKQQLAALAQGGK